MDWKDICESSESAVLESLQPAAKNESRGQQRPFEQPAELGDNELGYPVKAFESELQHELRLAPYRRGQKLVEHSLDPRVTTSGGRLGRVR
jgi:hypothetical protein